MCYDHDDDNDNNKKDDDDDDDDDSHTCWRTPDSSGPGCSKHD